MPASFQNGACKPLLGSNLSSLTLFVSSYFPLGILSMNNPNLDLEFLDSEPLLAQYNHPDECPATRDYSRKVWLQDGRKFSVAWRVVYCDNSKKIGPCLGKTCIQALEPDRGDIQRLAIALFKGESPVALRYRGTWMRETNKEETGFLVRVYHMHVSIGGVPVFTGFAWAGNVVQDVCKEIFEGDPSQTIIPHGEDSQPPPKTSPEWHPWNCRLEKGDYLEMAISLIQRHFPHMFSPAKYGVLGQRPMYNCKCCPPSWRPSIWYYCGVYVTTVVSQLSSPSVLSKKKLRLSTGIKKAIARKLVLFAMSAWGGEVYDDVFESDVKLVPYCARRAINQFNWE